VSVKHKAVSSTLWTMARIFLDQVFSFLVFVVVARILGPADVGIFALGMIVVEFGRIFSTSGFGDSVTKASADEEEEVARAAFWGNMALAVLCAILIALAAVPVAQLMQSPRLAPVIIALAGTVPISAGYAIHQARQLKRFGHKSLAIRSLVAGVIGGAVAIASAYAGAGVWSLVIQRIVTEVIAFVTIWLSFRWVPGFRFSGDRLRSILSFSTQMSASKLGNLVVTRFQDMVIGAYVSPSGVGVYRVAKRTIDMMMTGALTSFSTVSLSLFAAVREDEAKLRAAVIRIIAVSATVAFPIFAGMAVVAPDLIPLIYGPKWDASVVLLQLLTPLAVPALFSLLCMSILTIYSQAAAVSYLTLAQLVLTVLLSLISAPYGIEAVILAYLARLYLIMPFQIWLVARHAECKASVLVGAMARPLFASLVMAFCCYAALQQLLWIAPHPVMRLLCVSLLGAMVYAGLLWIVDRQSLRWLIELARGYAKRRA
jgi:O-antigen/teichoic acid export membrane protein